MYLEAAYNVCLMRSPPCLRMIGSYLREIVRAVERDERQVPLQQAEPAVITIERRVMVEMYRHDPG